MWQRKETFTMSKKEIKETGEKQEKVLTKYDRKVQRRKEEKEREEREKRISMITGIVIVVALVCLVASFPIRTYLTVNGTFARVAGENISRVEFDYNYNLVKNEYVTQNGYMLSYFGLDLSRDLSTQMYTETLSWQDFFEEMAMDNLVNNKALKQQARDAGFTYDTAQEYAQYEKAMKDAASEAGVSLKEYVKQLYGPYATMSRLEGIVKETMVIGAYFDAMREERRPSGEEIQAYYEENMDSYDSVDYRVVTVNAELPTEPTELADPVEDETPGEGEGEGTEGEDTPYQPSEAEIAAAMEEAREEADKEVKTVAREGELNENMKRSDAASLLRDWLFEEDRKAGDTTVIEDSTNHRYYVLAFEKRYLDQTPTANARVITTQEDNGQAILDEWTAGAATEESFGELADKYNATSGVEGGLYKGLVYDNMAQELKDWIFDSAREQGDTTVVTVPLGDTQTTYVMYYVGTNQPEWYLNIENTLLNQAMETYMEEISADCAVEDPKGNLNYLAVRAAQEAASQESQGSDSEGDQDGGDSQDSEGGQDSGDSQDSEGGQDSSDSQDGGEDQ